MTRDRVVDERAERVAFAAGLTILSALAAALILFAFTDPAALRSVIAQMAAHAALGKETGIPTGLAAGLAPPFVVGTAFAQDSLVLLIGYPLVVWAGRGLIRWTPLQRRLSGAGEARRTFGERTEPAGVALLALSIWIPFLPSGALAAALVGHAAGYRERFLLPALTLSILLSNLAYGILFMAAVAYLPDQAFLWGVAAVVAVLTLLLGWLSKRRSRHRR